MARKQTRRSVSMARTTYDIALEEAHERGISLAELVTLGLRALGVALPETHHMALEHVDRAVDQRRLMACERARVNERIEQRRNGPIRRALGDGVANMLGEP